MSIEQTSETFSAEGCVEVEIVPLTDGLDTSSMLLSGQPKTNSECRPLQAVHISVMKFSIATFASNQLSATSAPPPKLHFRTFWKSERRK
jgi:hypothetical protein